MLRASSEQTQAKLDLRAISGATDDPLLPAGRELLNFTSALVGRDDIALDGARKALLVALGPAAAVAAAACAGNFQMMNRLLDSTGVPLPRDRMITKDLGLALDWPNNLTD